MSLLRAVHEALHSFLRHMGPSWLAANAAAGAAALAVDARGRLQEAGWLKLPSLEHAAWAARYLSWRERALEARLDALSAREREAVRPRAGRSSRGGGWRDPGPRPK